MDSTKHLEEIEEKIKEKLYPWRKFTIAIDGFDGAGKSPLGRYLSWKLQVPLIETDLLIISHSKPVNFDLECLQKLVNARHSLDRPVIVEGIKILETLKNINIDPDFLVFVENLGFSGSHSLESEIKEYLSKFKSKEKAVFLYQWKKNYEFS